MWANIKLINCRHTNIIILNEMNILEHQLMYTTPSCENLYLSYKKASSYEYEIIAVLNHFQSIFIIIRLGYVMTF